MPGFWIPMATVKNDKILIWQKYEGTLNDRQHNRTKSDHAFSTQAQSRFGNCFDNFVNIFSSAHSREPGILQYSDFDKRKRQPVHLTLTVPRQNGFSDLQIKDKCLQPFIESISRYRQINLWLWKAEAQLRGEIHFHLVIDHYIEHGEARELWYNKMLDIGCVNRKELPLSQASRIVWLNPKPDLSALKLELSSYYASTNLGDEIVYKHDRTQRVRQIQGNSWGCCEKLKYRPMTCEAIGNEFQNRVRSAALESFAVKEKWTKEELQLLHDRKLSEEGIKNIADSKKQFCDVHLYKKFQLNKVNRKIEKQIEMRPFDSDIQETLNSYHWLQACKIYGKGISERDRVNRNYSRVDAMMLTGSGALPVLPSHEDDLYIWGREN